MKKLLLAFALIAIFMPNAFTAEYNAPATLTSLGTQAWTADEKAQALVGSSTVDFAAADISTIGSGNTAKSYLFKKQYLQSNLTEIGVVGRHYEAEKVFSAAGSPANIPLASGTINGDYQVFYVIADVIAAQSGGKVGRWRLIGGLYKDTGAITATTVAVTDSGSLGAITAPSLTFGIDGANVGVTLTNDWTYSDAVVTVKVIAPIPIATILAETW